MKKINDVKVVKWERKGPEKTIASKFGVSVCSTIFRNPKTGEDDEYAYFKKKEGFTVFSVTKGNNVILVQQFKQGVNQIVTEAPAGVPNKMETIIEAAKRELLAETGYKAQDIIQTNSEKFLLAPRKSPSGFNVFLATGCELVAEQDLDSGEDAIQILEVSPKEYWNMVKAGEIRATETVTAGFMAVLHGKFSF